MLQTIYFYGLLVMLVVCSLSMGFYWGSSLPVAGGCIRRMPEVRQKEKG